MVAAFAAASRVLGLLRDVLFASLFGATPQGDGFLVAFKLPNLLRRLFTEGAFAAALVPFFSGRRNDGARAVAAPLADLVGSTLWITGAAASLLVVAAPWLVWLLAPGFVDDPVRTASAVLALRWMAGFVPSICLVGVLVAALQAHGRFTAGAIAPLLLNVAIIGAAGWLLMAEVSSVAVVAAAVSLGGVLQLVVVLGAVGRLGLLRWPRLAPFGETQRRFLRSLPPVLLGASVLQLHLLVDTWMASFLPAGPVSWLYYAERLLELPSGLLAVGLVAVLLPMLSRASEAADSTRFAATLDWALARALVPAVPAALALVLLAEPMLLTLFARGAFGADDALQSAAALAAYAPGLLGLVAAKVLLPGYYARGDARTPLQIGLFSVALNLLLSALAITRYGHVGLAAATSCAALCNAGLLWRGLRPQRLAQAAPLRPALWWRVLLATGALAVVVLGLRHLIDWRIAAETLRIATLAGIVAAGLVAYVAMALALGVRGALPAVPPDL